MAEKLEHILDVQERINNSLGLKLPYNNIFSIFEFFYKFFKVGELKEEIEELKAEVAELKVENDALKTEIQEDKERIAFLEGELKECHCELEKCKCEEHHCERKHCDDHCEHDKCEDECEHKCEHDKHCFETKCGKIIINITIPTKRHKKHHRK
jgi:predicted nuclease with TOPRIM domain